MTAWIDTNVVVRYLVGEPADQAARATDLVDGDAPVRLALITLAESAYVLTKVYRRPRAAVVDALIELTLRENVEVDGVSAEVVVAALSMCRPSGRVDFADALLWARVRSAGGPVFTFDRRFPRDDVEVREP